MFVPEFVCGMIALFLLEIILTVIAAVISLRKSKKQCKDAVSEKEQRLWR
ncbi:MAG: hypothetical protein HFI95_04715 [Lachnospiraceae bacterium]|nr:hypothetical protein [Lachnospiraceae bacterium]